MSHPNARLTPHGRRLLAERIRSGWTITAAARAAGISRQTGSKWCDSPIRAVQHSGAWAEAATLAT